MSLAAIKNKVTSKVGRQVLVAQKHSPTMLVGVGVIGMATTVFLACRATLKMEEVLKDAENQEEIAETKKVSLDKVDLAIQIAKLYAPAAIVGTITIGALTGSHIILSRRNVAVTAAYAALDKGFKEYRGRVIAELGDEKDKEFRYGMVEREMAVDTDDGVAVKTVKVLDPEGFKHGRSIYAKIFDEYNKNWKPQHQYNAVFIRAQQNWANDLLNGRGHVLLNDVYDMLGFERTSAGAVVGWVKGNGDGYIDFGVVDHYDGMRFVNGDERSVVLDFNVDGIVYDLLGNSEA